MTATDPATRATEVRLAAGRVRQLLDVARDLAEDLEAAAAALDEQLDEQPLVPAQHAPASDSNAAAGRSRVARRGRSGRSQRRTDRGAR